MVFFYCQHSVGRGGVRGGGGKIFPLLTNFCKVLNYGPIDDVSFSGFCTHPLTHKNSYKKKNQFNDQNYGITSPKTLDMSQTLINSNPCSRPTFLLINSYLIFLFQSQFNIYFRHA